MPTPTQIERLAAMGNALRPDWPVASLRTHLERNHVDRAYRDLAVALAYVATDVATRTPARLAEDGPWWRTTDEPDEDPWAHVPWVGQPGGDPA